MPAMRFFMLAILFAVSSLASTGVGAAEQAVTTVKPAAKPDQIREPADSPLAPQDQQLDSLFSRLRKERSPGPARAIADQIRAIFAANRERFLHRWLQNAEFGQRPTDIV